MLTGYVRVFDVAGNILPEYRSAYGEHARELCHGYIDLHIESCGKIFINILGDNVGEIEEKFISILSRPLNRGIKYKVVDRSINIDQGSFALKLEFSKTKREFGAYPLDGATGIYAVKVHKSGSPVAVYVGQSMDIGRRAKWHFSDLHDGLHSNANLQYYYNNKYNNNGDVIFEFTVNVLKRVPHELCDELSIRRWMASEEAFYVNYFINADEWIVLNIEIPKIFQSRAAINAYNSELNSFDEEIKFARKFISDAIDRINKVISDSIRLKKEDIRHHNIRQTLKDVRRKLKTSKMIENQKYPLIAYVRGRVLNSIRNSISQSARQIPDWKKAIKFSLNEKRIPLELLYDLHIVDANSLD